MVPGNLTQRVDRLPGLDALLAAIHGGGGPAQIEGLTGAAKGLALARLMEREDSRTLLVTYQSEQVQRLWTDLRDFGIPEERLLLLPASERRWLAADQMDYRSQGERIASLAALAGAGPVVVIATADAALQRTCAPDDLIGRMFTLRSGEAVDLERLLVRLADLGYDADTTISRPGQFSRRGGILDVYPISADMPVRIELFGDDIESMRRFDVTTQRSTTPCDAVAIHPVREMLLAPDRIEHASRRMKAALEARLVELVRDRNRPAFEALMERVNEDIARLETGGFFPGIEEYLPYLEPQPLCALDYLLAAPRDGAPPLVVLDEPAQIRAHRDRLAEDVGADRERRANRGELLCGANHALSCTDGLERAAAEAPMLLLTQLPRTFEGLTPRHRLNVSAAPMDSYRARLHDFAADARTWLANGADVVIASEQPHRVREICAELDLPVALLAEETAAPRGVVAVAEGCLRQGFKFQDIGLVVATDAELFASTRPVIGKRRAATGVAISSLLDVREGDYVVHVNHGIGLYRGLVRRKVDGTDRDFLYIEYAGADRLYVPADQIDRVQRYVGAEGSPPQINKIGGSEWQRTTARAKGQARDLARGLIELYAARQAAERPSYGPDSPWQREMEDAFPYQETPSQFRAINDVKADLETMRPMDRLICGDVGFGKTEVAIRAAFKVVEAGKQVAVLCPTTVLAAQHHTTFSERLAAYPVKVDLLSRYRHRTEQRRTTEAIKAGEVDIIIGTHRVLSRDVEFSNLGLLIVDEEQRFGVAHKERLKQLRRTVDVMTLTATPIPRTLSMALSGLRDLSVIDDPPGGRVPIITSVREYDDEVARDAIQRELERGGQVYFVHNRIESIEYVAERLRKLIPDLRLRIGHGQMSEDELEKIMYDFYHREYDVLLCTTIIENGLDIPNVNTIVVDRADRMGLSQLYQLRGRVGRSNRQAYAHLFVKPTSALSEAAEQRLLAIREFTALGSGYQISLRDLEIRGAGNLLGAEQSGVMVSVGFDMYCRLLAEAVAEVKGETNEEQPLPAADLPVNAHIPDEYVPNEPERIFLYKRMANVRSTADIDALREEMEDRYGDPPKPVWTALEVLHLRLKARDAGIAAIRSERATVTMRFAPNVRLTPQALRILTHAFKNHRFTADAVVLTLTSTKVMAEVEDMLTVLDRALHEGPRTGKERRPGARS